MPKNDKIWSPRFLNYMEMIVSDPNYEGLPIERKKDGSLKWVATAKSKVGKKRIEWAKNKAKELGLEIRPGVYAELMRELHPTKWKVCQICGRAMSVYYYYPNAYFLKSLNEEFDSDFCDCDHISDIWDELINRGVSKDRLAHFLIDKGNLSIDASSVEKEDIIDMLEKACRMGKKKCLGPGAMSDFPDRFDGFHTYNRCCRATEDTGRSKDNMKSYTKDRRAYEYWSDGNIHAANQFMGSSFFEGVSADHIGPISLGFVHDPSYLQRMSNSDNSAKRDRLQLDDIEKIIETENRTKTYPMSWQSKLLWEHIKCNYETHREIISTKYRDALKQNMINYMFILHEILESCPKNGETFLIKAFLEPKYECFEYDYEFDQFGGIKSKKPRHFTDRSQNEADRYYRIAIESVYEYSSKDNRHLSPDLSSSEEQSLNDLCKMIEANTYSISDLKAATISLVEKIEKRLIQEL